MPGRRALLGRAQKMLADFRHKTLQEQLNLYKKQ